MGLVILGYWTLLQSVWKIGELLFSRLELLVKKNRMSISM